MRHGVEFFGLVSSAIIIAVAARYGFKTSDNDLDGYIWAFIYGAITFGGLGGHTVGVRLWRYGKISLALVIFAVSLFALAISLSNSLGAMAGRMNTTLTARMQIAETVRDTRRSLKRAEEEREALKFEATDWSAVEAAQAKAKAAAAAKEAECSYLRGSKCQKKEDEEAKALAEFETISKNKTAMERARALDAEIKALREKIEKNGPVLEANSQGSALARLFALPEGDAATLSTYQNLAMAVGIEILIVLSLIAYEVMSEHEKTTPAPGARRRAEATMAEAREPEKAREAAPVMVAIPYDEEPKAFPARPKPPLIASRADPLGSVALIMAEIMEPGRGKVEIADVFAAYAEACEASGKIPIPANEFPGAIAELCKRLGIQIEDDGEGVFLFKVRPKKPATARKGLSLRQAFEAAGVRFTEQGGIEPPEMREAE